MAREQIKMGDLVEQRGREERGSSNGRNSTPDSPFISRFQSSTSHSFNERKDGAAHPEWDQESRMHRAFICL